MGFKGGTKEPASSQDDQHSNSTGTTKHTDNKEKSENNKCKESSKVKMFGLWNKFDIFLDRIHLSLRGHETAFLTALCLFCTLLCVFVTDRHLRLELKVRNIEKELFLVSTAREKSSVEDLYRKRYFSEGDSSGRVRRSPDSAEEIKLSETDCTCIGLPGPPGPAGPPGAKGEVGAKGREHIVSYSR